VRERVCTEMAGAPDCDDSGWVAPFAGQDDPLPGQVVPFVPTPPSQIAAAFALARLARTATDGDGGGDDYDDEGEGEGEVVVDLGCGDGRVAVAAAVAGRRVRTRGIDIDAGLVAQARAAAVAAGVADRVSFSLGSFLAPDFALGPDATLVVCYAFPRVLRDLAPLLKRHVRSSPTSDAPASSTASNHCQCHRRPRRPPPRRVVSINFPIPTWRECGVDPTQRLWLYDASSQDAPHNDPSLALDAACAPAF